jgi:hypothetical protein
MFQSTIAGTEDGLAGIGGGAGTLVEELTDYPAVGVSNAA